MCKLVFLPLSYRREMHDMTLFFKMMRVFNWCDISHYVNVYDDSGRLRIILQYRNTIV